MWDSAISWITDQLNLTTVVAVMGFLLSLYTAISKLLEKQRKLKIRILAYNAVGSRIILTMLFENRSQLPIAITNIRFISGNQKINCRGTPKLVAESQITSGAGIALSRKEVFSDPLPFEIAALGAIGKVVLFEQLPEAPSSDARNLSFEVCTNRGKAFSVSLPLEPGLPSHHKVY